MSTRSNIIAKTETGYAGIYCHFDGYEDGVGATLLRHYKKPEKVAKLIALGDISQLCERVDPTGPHSFASPEEGTTLAYGRDRCEKGVEAFHAPTLEEVIDYLKNTHNGYVYVFDGEQWHLNGKPLTEVLRVQSVA